MISPQHKALPSHEKPPFGYLVLRVDKPGTTSTIDGRWERVDDGVAVHVGYVPSVTRYDADDVTVLVSGIVYLPTDTTHTYSTQSEFLAEAYRRDGVETLCGPAGNFVAFVIDKAQHRAYALGDVRGGRRVFYAEDEGAVYAASKLATLHDLGVSDGKPNTDYQEFALVYGYHPGRTTIYHDVSRLERDAFLELTMGALSVIERPRHLEPTVLTDPPPEAEVIDELYERLVAATESALNGFENIAVFMGGFDSALTAALAKRAGKNVSAYTFRYKDSAFNQANVDNVVKALDIKHRWVPIGPATIGQGLTDYRRYFDRPTNWPNYVIQTLSLGRVAADEGAQIALTGDGCDEIFLGYPGIYRGARFFSSEKAAPQCLVDFAQRLTRGPWKERKIGHIYRLVQRILANSKLPQRTRLYLMFRILDESTIAHLFGRPLREVERNVTKVVRKVEAAIPDYSVTLLAYEGRDPIIPNRLKISGTMDGAGIPVFSPYMHPHVRDYVRSLPESFLRATGEAKRDTLGKDVLLKMADKKGLLPHEVIYQPKHAAVDGPLDRWYERDLADQIRELVARIDKVADEKLLTSLVTEKPIEKFYRKHFSVDAITSHAASLLATYGAMLDSYGQD